MITILYGGWGVLFSPNWLRNLWTAPYEVSHWDGWGHRRPSWRKGGPMPLQSSSKLGTTCSTAPPSHQFLCPETLGRHMTLAMMKDKRQMTRKKKQYKFFKKLLGAFNNFRHLLANSINQFCNLQTFTSVLLLCFVNYLFFCHLYILFSW